MDVDAFGLEVEVGEGMTDMGVDEAFFVDDELEGGHGETCEGRGGWSKTASNAVDDPVRRGFGSP